MSTLMDNRRERMHLNAPRIRQVLVLLCGMLLVACSSTTPRPATESERIVEIMRKEGVDIVNLKSEPIKGPRGERIVENFTFDIPSISIKDGSAGTLRIFNNAEYAESQRRMYALLGAPGPKTKLDYVTIEGTHALFLDHRLPNDIAQRYIAAFKKGTTPTTET